MKTRVLLMTGLFALSMVAVGQAQAQQRMLVNVPFDFTAGKTVLPAGEYVIAPVDGWSGAVIVKGQDDANASAMLNTNAAQAITAPAKSKLVFHRYGNRYFLSEIWTEGQIRGRELPRPAAEKELAKLAKLGSKDEVSLEARLAPAKP